MVSTCQLKLHVRRSCRHPNAHASALRRSYCAFPCRPWAQVILHECLCMGGGGGKVAWVEPCRGWCLPVLVRAWYSEALILNAKARLLMLIRRLMLIPRATLDAQANARPRPRPCCSSVTTSEKKLREQKLSEGLRASHLITCRGCPSNIQLVLV